MNTNRKAEIITCSDCNGKGATPEGTRCLGCQGAGVIGSDGIHEYYLSLDKDGKPIVTGVKEKETAKEHIAHPSDENNPNKKNVFSLFLLILIIVLYLGFFTLHFTVTKNSSVFGMVTIIFVGSLILILLTNSKIFNNITEIIIGQFIQEPKDFLYYIKTKRKE